MSRGNLHRLVALTGALACTACSRNDDSGTAPAPQWRLSDEPEVQIGAVAGDPADNLDAVQDAFLLSDGTIGVVSGRAGTIALFDRQGNHLRTFGGPGDGPGEFQDIGSVWTEAGDVIAAYDRQHARVTWFGPNGSVRRVTSLRPAGAPPEALLGTLDDGTFATYRIYGEGIRLEPTPTPDPMIVSRFGRDGEPLGELARLGGLLRMRGEAFSGVHPFSTRLSGGTTGTAIIVGNGEAGELFRIDPSTGAAHAVSLGLPEAQSASAADWTDLQRALESASGPMAELMRREGVIDAVPRDLPLPFYSALLTDREGRVWVKAYTPSTDNTWTARSHPAPGGVWWVYTPEGARLATVTMPPAFLPLEIGADYVLGLHRDDLDVEYVRLYRIVGNT